MDRIAFLQRLRNEVLILDGAMGTLLQPDLPPGACLDLAVLEKPDRVGGIHSAYAAAGADIISTNTFGANRVKLGVYGLADKVKILNHAAAVLARKSAGDGVLVAGCMGPTGKLVEPLGDLTLDEACDAYREQAGVLVEGGVDLFLLETFSDLKEIKAALIALREFSGIPVMACFTFDEGYTSFTGTDPETAANVLISMGADVLGVNCSTGPEPMLEVVGRFALTTETPILVEPNAGIPRLKGKSAIYQVTPDAMAGFAERFVELGAAIVGTCCGSTPEYTARLSHILKGRKPVERKAVSALRLSSRTRTVSIGDGLPFAVIGERINPTNREDLAAALREGSVGPLQKEAKEQAGQGAVLVDVNIGVPGVDETRLMRRVVTAVENAVPAPLVIDSPHPGTVEAALRESAGKLLINSVNGSDESLSSMLPLARRYGAGLLCLAMDEKGIPRTAEERIRVLEKIVQRALDYGIPRRDLICDCLTLTVSAQQKRAFDTLKAVRMVKEKLGLPAVLGVSNISFGLPRRSEINAAFLGIAMGQGLDAAIMNPGDKRMMETVRAASVLVMRDLHAGSFIAAGRKKKAGRPTKITANLKPDEQKLYRTILLGNRDEVEVMMKKVLDGGRKPSEINSEILIPAIQEVGIRYDKKEIYLPQMILSAETMQRACGILEPLFGKGETRKQGKILLCTVKGDVHDIGKNIVGLFLKNHGFDVIDLGRDVPLGRIVSKTLEEKPDIVGLSALMTTTMTQMPAVIGALRERGSTVPVIVGGAVITKRYAGEIGADGYAADGVSAVDVVKSIIGVKTGR